MWAVFKRETEVIVRKFEEGWIGIGRSVRKQ